MAEALNKIFGEIAEYTKTMGSLHNDFLHIVRRDIDRFLEKTRDLNNQQNLQGWTILGLTSLSASLAIAGALIPPKATPAAASNAPTDPRLSTNAGINDGFSKTMKAIGDKLADNDFLSTTCKTTSKFFDGVTPAAKIWFDSKTTDIESKRTLLERVNIPNAQGNKSTLDQNVSQAQQAALRILESKTKGG
jgi:ankyrin repeat protein